MASPPATVATTGTVTFSIVLHSSQKVLTKALTLPALPGTVDQLQGHIETAFSIPKCCQSLSLDSDRLRCTDSLIAFRVRDGDTFHVHYSSTADVSFLRDTLDAMQDMVSIMESQTVSGVGIWLYRRERVSALNNGVHPEIVELLASRYFWPYLSELAIANRLFFLQQGGLRLLHSLHSLVLLSEWQYTPVSVQRLEQAILRVLWNMTASFDVRHHILQYPFLELCICSAKRVQIGCNTRVTAPMHLAGHETTYDQDCLLREVMYKACGTICNLAELPSCQIAIASDHSLMTQLTAIMLSPSYLYIASLVVASGLQSLAYNVNTHSSLLQPGIMEGMLEVGFLLKQQSTSQEKLANKKLLRYFGSLFFAHILATSLHLVPKIILIKVYTFMKLFLRDANAEDLHSLEVENGYIWSTLRPHVNLTYCPLTEQHNSIVISGDEIKTIIEALKIQDYNLRHKIEAEDITAGDIYLQVIETGIVSLENMTLGKPTQQVLQDEGLLDFITCLPWVLPQGSRVQCKAAEVAHTLSLSMKPGPPSLVNICSSKLAASQYGLDKILTAKSIHSLLQV